MPTTSLPRRLSGLVLATLAVLCTAAVTTLVSPGAARADPLPTAVVALGDSAASGEGAGDYVPGTRGEGGDWCHRSPAAYVHRTGLAAVGVNLACSGAASANVGFGGPAHHTEGSQAARLTEVARTHRVPVVTLQVGSNDEPDLSGVAAACVRAFLDLVAPPCRETVGPSWPARLAAMSERVEAAARDVRTAMREAGHRDDDYVLVLLSYPAPGTEAMPAWHVAQGCPYSRPDAAWSRTVAFPQLAEAIGRVAQRVDARFLDLTRLAEGREACTGPPDGEWARRLTAAPWTLLRGPRDQAGWHLVQESFHPTAPAHAAIGGCLTEFVRGGAPRGTCLPDGDGSAHPQVRA